MAGTSAIVFLPDDTARTGLEQPLMLTPVAGSPLLAWLCGAMYRAGVRRMLLVCRQPWTAKALEACPRTIAVTTAAAADASDSLHVFLTTAEAWEDVVTVIPGPVVFDRWTAFCAGPEPAGDARTPCGVRDVPREALLEALEQQDGEFDFIQIIQSSGVAYTDADGLYPLSAPSELTAWRTTLQTARVRELEACGADVWDPRTLWAGPEVTVGEGTQLLPGVILRGATCVGPDCTIGPDSVLTDAVIGAAAVVNASQVTGSTLGAHAQVGPYASVGPGAKLGERAVVGPFVQVSGSTLEADARLEGLNHVANAELAQGAVFAPGAVTAAQEGPVKLAENACAGANATLTGPVTLGAEAAAAAGSTITEDVPDGAMGSSAGRQSVLKDYLHRRNKK